MGEMSYRKYISSNDHNECCSQCKDKHTVNADNVILYKTQAI